MLLLSMLVATFAVAQFATKADARRGKESPRHHYSNKLVLPHAGSAVQQQASPKAIQTTYFTEGFEDADITTTGWVSYDQDNDGNGWGVYTYGFHSGLQCASSASWTTGSGALTPDNWLISPQIDLTSATGTLFLDWWVAAQDPDWEYEHYKVVLSTTDDLPASFTTTLFEETLPQVGTTQTYFNRQANISAYAGQPVFIAFVHYNCTDMFQLNIDDVSIYDVTATDAGVSEIIAPNNDAGCQLGAAENVTVRISNYGGVAISNFPVSYSINGGAAVTETCTQSIAPAGFFDYTFTTTGNFSTLGIYSIEAYTAAASDVNAANDGVTGSVHSSDAHITITSHTDSSGTTGWYVLNNMTGDTVAKDYGFMWNVDYSAEICVFSDSCYQVVYYADAGLMDSYAWVTISYNGTVVGGSATPGSFTTSPLVVDNQGNGCPGTDAGVTGFVGLDYAGCNATTLNVTVAIKNFGTDIITGFPVSYIVNNGTPVTENVTASIASGATYNYNFTATAAAIPGTNTFRAYTSLVGDANTGNDAFNDTTVNFTSVSVPYSSSFDSNPELLGWTLENTNLDNTSWGMLSGGTYAHTGTYALAYTYSATLPADDWLFSPCLDLIAGTSYKLDFWYRAAGDAINGIYPEKIAAYVGNDNTSAAMSNLIVDLSNIADSVYAFSTTSFTVNTTGTYNIGFHCYSDANMWYAIVDDVLIDFASNVNSQSNAEVEVYPNPANSVLNIDNAAHAMVSIYNVLGQQVYTQANSTNHAVIDLSGFADGNYVVKVQSDKMMKTTKISLVK